MARHYEDDDDLGDGDLKSMRQVYGALVRQGASADELTEVAEERRGEPLPKWWEQGLLDG